GASAMARPGSVWARNQVGVEIPWVRRHFLANPRWELQALVRGRKFNFRDDQPGVGAIKFVDLPHPPAERNTIATLVDQGLKAEVVKHLFGIGRRYRVLEFGTFDTDRDALDGEVRTVAGRAYPHDASGVGRQITLPEPESPRRIRAP